MRYLEVKFHDNDFSSDIQYAVRQIWNWIKNDYNSHSSYDKRSIIESFLILHEEQRLERMIKKMVLLNALNHDVEWATRGLYRNDEIRLTENIKCVTDDAPHLQKYFSKLEIEFHETKDFAENWQNFEHICFDLENGLAGSF